MGRWAIAWMAFAVLLPTPDKAMAQTAAGAVRSLSGSATVTRQNATQPLKTGDAILSDDALETGSNAKLLVEFIDGTALTLGPDAEVVIDEFVYNPRGGTNNAALRATAGAMRLVAGAVERVGGAKAVTVTTPVGVIGIRGTDFFIEMEREHLSVALFSGFEIAVRNNGGETILRPGEGTDVWGSTAPSQALTWGADRINRALALVTVARTEERPLPYVRPVASADTAGEALISGAFKLDARYRYEYVDHAAQPRTAYASTARVRIGYETLNWNGLFAGVEGEFTEEIGNNRRSDGVHNFAALPLIADPESEALNQAYAGWAMPGGDGMPSTRAIIGRQRIAYENERWVGPGAFRQNDQTFDAATIETRAIPGLALRYAYVERVNRILGDNPGGHWHSDSHFIGATTTLVPFGLTTAYVYLLDLRPVPTLSSATYGVRYEGMIDIGAFTPGLEAEVARQTDYARNPNNFGLTYALVRPSLRWRDTTVYAGWEQLGGNGAVALQTPLATLHRHNGWADVFTTTPVGGLRDLHVRVLQELPDLGPIKTPKIDLRYHDFHSVRGNSHYGTEFDLDVNATVLSRVTLGIRYADYNAKRFDSDTQKLWLYVEFQY